MRRIRATAATALAAALAGTAAGCGGGSAGGGGSSNDNPEQLTYWASNQGATVEEDKRVLGPELKKFQRRTGITVKLEVIPWSDLLNRVLAATISGQGPDVLNIGNTWSASLQAGGALLPFDDAAFQAIGGKDRFVPSALAATGAAGKDPAAVPLYSLAYGLYYNKKLFKQAGIDKPPATWDELVAAGKKLTGRGRWGLAIEGASYSENSHHAFVLGKQHGADFFDSSGRPRFDSPGAVAAVRQFVDLLATDRIVAPGNAEYATQRCVRDFAAGKAAMLMWQSAAGALKAHNMTPKDYGVAPVPVQTKGATGGKGVNSMVAGINLAVFKNTDNHDGALKFVKFMTSVEEQKRLNSSFGALPPVKEAQRDKAFATPDLTVLRETLAKSAAPLPMVPEESQFETLVGTAMKELLADAAAGHEVGEASVKERLAKAQQQMPPR
ncbi:sugar ABC transporter substrate-binding protein [Streptomyces sp. NPDC050617]|uniref:ABC transporter substrate-binding protein n=1 Tax=Streptomyces sp. NPDC050617 TaxID=3154628 RepID=UPI0034153E8A